MEKQTKSCVCCDNDRSQARRFCVFLHNSKQEMPEPGFRARGISKNLKRQKTLSRRFWRKRRGAAAKTAQPEELVLQIWVMRRSESGGLCTVNRMFLEHERVVWMDALIKVNDAKSETAESLRVS